MDNNTTSEPKKVMSGTFALYETPDGGYHLAYRPDTAEEDQHVQIPGMYVKLLTAHKGKKMGSLLRGLVG